MKRLNYSSKTERQRESISAPNAVSSTQPKIEPHGATENDCAPAEPRSRTEWLGPILQDMQLTLAADDLATEEGSKPKEESK